MNPHNRHIAEGMKPGDIAIVTVDGFVFRYNMDDVEEINSSGIDVREDDIIYSYPITSIHRIALREVC